MSKGSIRRPLQISRAEEELRWNLACGRISRKEFDKGMERLKARDRPASGNS